MDKKPCARGLSWALLALLLLTLLPAAGAAEVDVGAVYCFQSADFQTGTEQELTGVCITGVPSAGNVLLGSRVILPGDILTVHQLDNMTFSPAVNATTEAQITYLPICGSQVEEEAVMTISIKKKENKPPVAQNGALETYKNLENTGTLSASDPEGSALTYTVVAKPKRGEVTIHDDGTFTYTPKKNKVGKDSFTYSVTDADGAVSNEAVVEIQILKPLDSAAYKDVQTGQFEAMWMRNTGLFAGSQVAGENCFGPEEPVTRGDFLAMAMKLLQIPVDESLTTSGFADEADAAQWLRPYLATAMRLGVISGTREDGKVVFRPNDPITGAEAAVLLDNILQLPAGTVQDTAAPDWAESSVQAMSSAGVTVATPTENLTRLETARLLYSVSKVSNQAPGLEVFRQGN